jgi:hypothetical protein
MTKIVTTCPSTPKPPYLENAIRLMLQEFKINSIPIKTRIAFLRETNAYKPIPKRTVLNIKK